MTAGIDFDSLRNAASTAMTRAYAPYSGFAVGAAGITLSGQIITGSNVENVSYGLGLCAEVSMVAAGISLGRMDADRASRERLIAVSVCDARGSVLTPCGRCRQVLLEFGGEELLVDSAGGPRPLRELLPDAFGPGHLEAIR
ncbi:MULTISPECIES: cytidine deaminase [Gordonia]|uniref:Cytidine deaminase n=1 Tax=Gordonia cholesterolivorans TaxID=559625 RepID=A0ABN3HED6_9ACTN|nr:cytidine deaminase [Gordonia sp. QH-12]KXT57382.1 cytidine deaminase [Gordonia sp. QH-12]